MAERTCTGERGAPLCRTARRLARRVELENTPTTRISARSDRAPADRCPARDCDCAALAGALEVQNRLLCDILGAVNALTAARLANCRKEAQ